MPIFEPPYYAVVFTSRREPADDGYAETADRMAELAAEQPGYLGMDSTRGPDGLGITVSYWRDEESITGWRRNAEHTLARERGRTDWYAEWAIHVAKVERAYQNRA
ncbi:heme-degrading monooxygenase HmoA [Allocatelliglobosispora scoriae]|uniref:Heme-degrading monooxygenase HmoA n=1 Tax=Allocatelliglobosispora scoriae TaxID=643052 RepID=A0A841BUB5_9ACTN|nr:antibiotic biosynthesis monooxygenase [Allocatelliglobosispora scoriae]MBB5870360.1 heme-degrading monooxygenase HmoA [Allocatelliglobosispora scoriae]